MAKTVVPGHQVKDSSIAEVDIGLSDNTTNDVSISKHGLVPKAPNDTAKFLRGDATWADLPAGGSGDVVGPASSGNNQIVLFDGLTGKAIKAHVGTGVVHATSGVISAENVVESEITLADNTTNDVSSTKHGLVPKSPADATKFLNGATTPVFAQPKIPIPISLTNRVLSPNDAATYYWGCLAGMIPTTTSQQQSMYFGCAGTITKAYIQWNATSAAGSNENVSIYIRLNDTTDYLIATVGNTNAIKQFQNTGLSVPIAVGDFIEIKVVCPTWATNPTVVAMGGMLLIEVNTI